MKTIGVLAMQGAVSEHLDKLAEVGARGEKIRDAKELSKIDGLIIPGGESTAIGKLLDDFALTGPLAKLIRDGLPVWGTCAGMILLAKKIHGQEKTYLNAMDITVRRNAYGSQLDSFETEQIIASVSAEKLPLVFIRAPYIESADEDAAVLAEVGGNIVAARQHSMLVTSFHPELTENNRFHQYFLKMCR